MQWDGDPARPVDALDPDVWERLGWGLANPDQAGMLTILEPDVPDAAERRERALALQRRLLTRVRGFMNALDQPATTPDGLDIMLIAGDALPTPGRLGVDSRTGAIELLEEKPGDGTVLRSSAVLDERTGGPWKPFVDSPLDLRTTMFLPEEHLDLTRNTVFRDNVPYWLLEAPR